MYKIELYSLAENELLESFQWYERCSVGLGKRFIDAVDKRMEEIANHPERYPIKKGNYREVKVEKFPYTIIYEVLNKVGIVLVLHIFHTKRNPIKKFKKR